MEEVTERIRQRDRGRAQITVHGDYDVDGVCATAILVGALRELGADCDWFIPDRLGDGYGLTAAGWSGWPRAAPGCCSRSTAGSPAPTRSRPRAPPGSR